MLATGEIPGLLGKEDKDLIPVQCKPIYMKEVGQKGEDPPPALLWQYFLNRVKDNLHMVLALGYHMRRCTVPHMRLALLV